MIGYAHQAKAQTSQNTNLQLSSDVLSKKFMAISHVMDKTGGRVLNVELHSSMGGQLWRVKFLKEGHIQFMDVYPDSIQK